MTYNLSRQTFKSAQRAIEHASKGVLADFKTAQQSTTKAKGTPEATIDGMITKMTNLKRKLETLHEDEQKLNRASMARIEHLQTLYDVNSLVDVKYEEWSRTRLSRLLVDYLLRSGYTQSANALAKAKGIEDLVDIDSFLSAEKIERSLRQNHNTAMALNWCKDNEKALQKMDPNMELQLELRLQQFIEMVRAAHEKTRPWDGTIVESPDETALKESEKLLAEARAHARKYLAGEASMKRLSIAAGLLAFRHWDAIEPYDVRYCMTRSRTPINKLCPGTLLGGTLGCASRPLHHDTSQAFLAPYPPPSAHRPQRWSLSPQDPILSFQPHILVRQHVIKLQCRLPHLLDRAQRTGQECAVRSPHQEYC
jgi:macrophage erythroblast attacher